MADQYADWGAPVDQKTDFAVASQAKVITPEDALSRGDITKEEYQKIKAGPSAKVPPSDQYADWGTPVAAAPEVAAPSAALIEIPTAFQVLLGSANVNQPNAFRTALGAIVGTVTIPARAAMGALGAAGTVAGA